MKKNNVGQYQNPAHDSLWDQVDRLIQSMASPAEVNDGELWSMTFGDDAISSKDRKAFLQAVSKDFSPTPHAAQSSMLERWVQENRRSNWLARMRERLHHLETLSEQWTAQLKPVFQPMEDVLTILGGRMVPAPAHRSASASKDRIYQPRRRAIEPADLPGFNPLFCTAIEPNSGPITLSGLSINTNYRFLILDSRNPENRNEHTLMANEEGTIQIDLPHILSSLQEENHEAHDFVWFLEEITEESGHGSWTSGLVWLEDSSTHSITQQTEMVIKQSAEKDRIDSSINTLFDINLLTVREFYIHAYEKARQCLLFTPKTYKEENQIPFKESLWQFIHMQINEIVQRLEKSEDVFRQIRPQWNAVESLRDLQKRLMEWD